MKNVIINFNNLLLLVYIILAFYKLDEFNLALSFLITAIFFPTSPLISYYHNKKQGKYHLKIIQEAVANFLLSCIASTLTLVSLGLTFDYKLLIVVSIFLIIIAYLMFKANVMYTFAYIQLPLLFIALALRLL